MKRLKISLLMTCLVAAGFVQAKDKGDEEKYQWKDGKSGGYSYKYVSNDPMQSR